MTTSPDSARPDGSQQFLTFILGNETYGVDILRVHEIRCWSAVTRIPHAPAHVLGVLNLRGSIVPIMDLRVRFALENAGYTSLTVIIVLSVQSRAGRREVGVVVDGVSDVVDVGSDAVRPTPDVGSRESLEHVRGIVPVADRMVMLLDIDRLVGADTVEHSDEALPSVA